MRIALLLPTWWPEVQRGSERLVHDLGVSLAARGHEVTVLTTHRRRGAETNEDGLRVRRRWRPPEAGPLGWYEHHVATAPGAGLELARGRYDLAHAFFLTDAWAAAGARRLGGPPFVYSIHGIATREWMVARRRRIEMLQAAIGAARWTSVLSEAAARPLRTYLGFEPRILPGGVDTELFAPGPRADRPTVVCAASLGDPRKGASTLFEAWHLVQAELPGARLRLAAGSDPVMSRSELPELPPGAELVTCTSGAELAGEYAAAWVSVLPSTDEAFGLVALESLACGTPVVVADSGASPELITTPGLGRVVEPGSAKAMAAALSELLAKPPSTSARTAARKRAQAFAWETVSAAYEDAYGDAIGD